MGELLVLNLYLGRNTNLKRTRKNKIKRRSFLWSGKKKRNLVARWVFEIGEKEKEIGLYAWRKNNNKIDDDFLV